MITPYDYYFASVVIALVSFQSAVSAGRYNRSRGLRIFDGIAAVGLAILAFRLWNAA